ncbi:MAG: transposase [Cyanosarcina radialis HA8281-LM2]|nr:transposase [Cyanosarcina radialis HA8281-LM2]
MTEQLERIYPQIMTKIKFQLSTKPSKPEKAQPGKSGFVPAIARWVVERSNAWMERCKILSKNFERTLSIAIILPIFSLVSTRSRIAHPKMSG